MKTVLFFTLRLMFFFAASQAHAGWDLYEQTNVNGNISGSITKGTLIEMRSGSIYEVYDRVRMRVRERKPDAMVLNDGRFFKLIIEGFDEPLICVQLVKPSHQSPSISSSSEVISSNIDGDFEGWDGETIFKLDNGQIWQQSSYAYMYHYAYRPEVMIINVNGTSKMKVEDVSEMVEVTRLK